MIKLISVPFPRSSLKKYVAVACSIGFMIAFVLNVFEPFGSDQLENPRKFLILSGYGFVVSAAVIVYYAFSLKLFNPSKSQSWNILYEVFDLFCSFIFALLACYLYALLVINFPFSFKSMGYFLMYASSVAFLPVTFYLFYLYIQWSDVRRSVVDFTSGAIQIQQKEAKQDPLEAINLGISTEQLVVAQAQDNYVMFYLDIEGKIERHIIRQTMKAVQQHLVADKFKVVHRSYLINLLFVDSLQGNKSKAWIKMQGIDKNIPVSRTYYDQVKKLVSS